MICENFYGRMKRLWAISRLKYRSKLELYDKIIDICISLTNFHIDLHSLRQNDSKFYRNLSVQTIRTNNRASAHNNNANRLNENTGSQSLS